MNKTCLMKKAIVLSLALALMLGMTAGVVWGDVFPNNTLVEQWNTTNTAPTLRGGWVDVLGITDPGDFRTYGGKLVGSHLYLYTEFGGANHTDTLNSSTVRVADLFLDTNLDGTFDTAVRMRSDTSSATGDGSIFASVTSANWYTSKDKMYGAGGGYIFGGRYDEAAPKDVPVEIHDLTASTSTTVTWSQLSSAISLGSETVPQDAWEVDVDLSGISGLNTSNFAFLWATGTCANDTAQGTVPLPGAVVLLGAGLVRLTAYARRKRSLA